MLELSLRESLQLRTNYIGPEHILLALLREGSGVAIQILTLAGVDLNRARQQVIELLPGQRGEEPSFAAAAPLAASAFSVTSAAPSGDDLVNRLASFVARLNAIELRLSQSGGV